MSVLPRVTAAIIAEWPDLVAELRPALYAQLTGIANRWNATMGIDIRYPDRHEAFLQRCHDAGQVRPTPTSLDGS